jgi:CMP-N,N'-diacetyllegionaminic acid synthase
LKTLNGVCWGLILARGGSKTIPLKNMAPLAGRPLIDYCVSAARAASSLSRLICSTDSDDIAHRCEELGVEILQRPGALAEDMTPTADVIAHFAGVFEERDEKVAELIALLQPTSPFVLPAHIDTCVDKLRASPEAASVQTVIPCPDHFNALSQRIIDNGRVCFRYAKERRQAHNKQLKPDHYVLGNFLAFRLGAAVDQGFPFPDPSIPVEIPEAYALDADGRYEFKLGEAMLAAGLVELPHLD